jgi:beta-galactosidase
VQADNTDGNLQIHAASPGLKSASLKLPVVKTALIPQVQSPVPISLLHYWRISPASSGRQDPNQTLSDNDMNSWGWGQIPVRELTKPEGNWRLFRTTFTPRADLADGRAQIIFDHLAGKTEVWLDGKMLGKTDSYDTKNFSVTLPAGKQHRQLTLLIEAEPGKTSGVIGKVKIEK